AHRPRLHPGEEEKLRLNGCAVMSASPNSRRPAKLVSVTRLFVDLARRRSSGSPLASCKMRRVKTLQYPALVPPIGETCPGPAALDEMGAVPVHVVTCHRRH